MPSQAVDARQAGAVHGVDAGSGSSPVAALLQEFNPLSIAWMSWALANTLPAMASVAFSRRSAARGTEKPFIPAGQVLKRLLKEKVLPGPGTERRCVLTGGSIPTGSAAADMGFAPFLSVSWSKKVSQETDL